MGVRKDTVRGMALALLLAASLGSAEVEPVRTAPEPVKASSRLRPLSRAKAPLKPCSWMMVVPLIQNRT